ncbi:MAG: STAS domain-containing protein [Firmicutes bacterium]|nr:STAS domain-containing protein [Bacillota bacterium]
MLNITKKAEGSNLTLGLEGRLDTNTAPELDAEIKSSLAGVTSVVLDMAKLEYISSAGLRVLMSAQKIMNDQGEMKLINVNEIVNEVFEVTGFSEILTIE